MLRIHTDVWIGKLSPTDRARTRHVVKIERCESDWRSHLPQGLPLWLCVTCSERSCRQVSSFRLHEVAHYFRCNIYHGYPISRFLRLPNEEKNCGSANWCNLPREVKSGVGLKIKVLSRWPRINSRIVNCRPILHLESDVYYPGISRIGSIPALESSLTDFFSRSSMAARLDLNRLDITRCAFRSSRIHLIDENWTNSRRRRLSATTGPHAKSRRSSSRKCTVRKEPGSPWRALRPINCRSIRFELCMPKTITCNPPESLAISSSLISVPLPAILVAIVTEPPVPALVIISASDASFFALSKV